MFLPLTLLLLASLPTMITGARHKRSVAPFLGAGGSRPTGMILRPDLWHCGSDVFTRNVTYNAASKDCPSLVAALNHCCAVHDDCYGQQSGQTQCDQNFCDCNEMVTRLPTEEGYKCRASTADACEVVKFMGMIAYGFSNYSDPSKLSGNILTTPNEAPNIQKDYMDLYSSCPYVNITLASCATNYNLCALVHSVDFCSNDLCHCMLDAAEADVAHKKQCSRSVAHMCRLVLKHSSEVLASRSVTRYLVIVASLFVVLSSIGFCLVHMFARVTNDKKKFENEKYSHIHTVESSRSVNPLLSSAQYQME